MIRRPATFWPPQTARSQAAILGEHCMLCPVSSGGVHLLSGLVYIGLIDGDYYFRKILETYEFCVRFFSATTQ